MQIEPPIRHETYARGCGLDAGDPVSLLAMSRVRLFAWAFADAHLAQQCAAPQNQRLGARDMACNAPCCDPTNDEDLPQAGNAGNTKAAPNEGRLSLA